MTNYEAIASGMLNKDKLSDSYIAVANEVNELMIGRKLSKLELQIVRSSVNTWLDAEVVVLNSES